MRYEVYDGYNRLTDNRWPYDVHGCEHYRVLLIVGREELEYDIANMAYTQGDVARVMDNYGHDHLASDRDHLMHQWRGVCEDGNIDRVRRMTVMGLNECKQMLYKYTRHSLHRDVTLDNCMEDKVEYAIELRVPTSFSGSSCDYLMSLVHEYIIDKVLSDWASITFPEAVPIWEGKRAETERCIRLVATSCGVHHQVKPSM